MHTLGSVAIASGAIASLSLATAHASAWMNGISNRSQLDTNLRNSSPSQFVTSVQPVLEQVALESSLTPAMASASLSATVTPGTIQLGDTLTVHIQLPAGSPTPSVTFRDRQFPAFPLSSQPHSDRQLYRALVPSSPLDTPGAGTLTVTAGDERQTLPVTIRARTFPTQSITIGSGGLQATQVELDAVSQFKAISSPMRYWNGPFLRPSGGPVSAVYGVRRYYNGVFASDYYHRGVDYAAPLGAPIVAPAAGTIALVGRETEGFTIHGNTVGIDHGQGVVSIFLHLNQISVTEGQEVEAGQQVGTIGTTGASTGPHLHWGLYVHEVAVDPVPWRYQGFE
ncbi:MAG: M23 family metallopeptidase [Synechococcus sp.]